MKPSIISGILVLAVGALAAGPKDVIVRMKGGWKLRRASVDSVLKSYPTRVPSYAASELILLEQLRQERVARGLPVLEKNGVKRRIFESIVGPRTQRNGEVWDEILRSYEEEPAEVEGCELPAFLLETQREQFLPDAKALAALDTSNAMEYIANRAKLVTRRGEALAKELKKELAARYPVEYLDESYKPQFRH